MIQNVCLSGLRGEKSSLRRRIKQDDNQSGSYDHLEAMSYSDLNEILFLDIETVPCFRKLDEVPVELRDLWVEIHGSKKKRKKPTKKKSEPDDTESSEDCEEAESSDSNYETAGYYAEFARIICISLGRFEGGIEDQHLKIHSLSSHNEKEILTSLSTIFERYSSFRLCAHNGKGFDFPFMGRRFLINHLPLPSQLNIMGKKPWDIPHIDTMDLWAFGSRNNTVKLKLLCAVLGVPSPKDDIDGSMVRQVYYEENDLSRIVKYCEKDVVSLARVYKKLRGYF